MKTNFNAFKEYHEKKIDTPTIWILHLILGWSYGSMDEILKQILYYLTGAGLGLWFFYRCFTLNNKIRAYNIDLAYSVGLDAETIEAMIERGEF